MICFVKQEDMFVYAPFSGKKKGAKGSDKRDPKKPVSVHD